MNNLDFFPLFWLLFINLLGTCQLLFRNLAWRGVQSHISAAGTRGAGGQLHPGPRWAGSTPKPNLFFF